MSGITHYYLVDLENVGLQGLCGMNMPGADAEIQIFLSNSAHVGTEEVRRDILASRAENGINPRIYKKGKSIDFKQIMEERREKSAIEVPIREILAEKCDEAVIQKVLDLIMNESLKSRERYLTLLKTLGKNKGLQVYRFVKEKSGQS